MSGNIVQGKFTVENPGEGPYVIIQLVTFLGPGGKKEQYYEIIGFIPAGATQIVYPGTVDIIKGIHRGTDGKISFPSGATTTPKTAPDDYFFNSGTGTQTGDARLFELNGWLLDRFHSGNWKARNPVVRNNVSSGMLAALPVVDGNGPSNVFGKYFSGKSDVGQPVAGNVLTVSFSGGVPTVTGNKSPSYSSGKVDSP